MLENGRPKRRRAASQKAARRKLRELPPLAPSEIHPLDFEQSAAFLEAVADYGWAALYQLALNLGMREGKLLRRVPGPDGKKVFALQITKPARVLVATI